MPTFTTSALESRVYDLLDNNTAMFPEPNVLGALNNGLARMNVLLGLSSATATVSGGTVANQLSYNTPSSIFIPLRYDYDGRELQKMPIERLARSFPRWASDASNADGPPSRVGVVDLFQFVIHPKDYYGGATLEVTGIVPITPLVNSGDTVGLEDQFVEILIAYAKMRLLLKVGGKAFSDSVAAFSPYRAKLKEACIWKAMVCPDRWINQKLYPGSQRGLA